MHIDIIYACNYVLLCKQGKNIFLSLSKKVYFFLNRSKFCTLFLGGGGWGGEGGTGKSRRAAHVEDFHDTKSLISRGVENVL